MLVDSTTSLLEASSETGKLELSRDDDGRYLQATRQLIVFDSCLFEDNRQGVNTFGGEQVGIITIISTASDVVIRGSTFRENVFADTQRVRAMVCDHKNINHRPLQTISHKKIFPSTSEYWIRCSKFHLWINTDD
jgi:hypothetical protein